MINTSSCPAALSLPFFCLFLSLNSSADTVPAAAANSSFAAMGVYFFKHLTPPQQCHGMGRMRGLVKANKDDAPVVFISYDKYLRTHGRSLIKLLRFIGAFLVLRSRMYGRSVFDKVFLDVGELEKKPGGFCEHSLFV